MNKQHRFTGRQITAMVIALCAAAVLTPVGAIAATGSFVSISDPTHPTYRARVSANGSLSVTPRDAVTGTAARVNTSGQQLVTGNVAVTSQPPVSGTVGISTLPPVSGTVGVSSLPPVTGSVSISGQPDVTTHEGLPGTPYTISGNFSLGSGYLPTIPAGKTFVIETISVRITSSSAGGNDFILAGQNGGSNVLYYASPQLSYTSYGNYFYDESYSTHLYVDGGTTMDAQTDNATGAGSLVVFLTGYLI